MKTILKNSAAVIIGFVAGSIVNMSIINISGKIIPPPEGADLTTTEGLIAAMHLFEPKHFLMPFLAHAVGTFVGALVALLIAGKTRKAVAYITGGIFLAGGIAAVFMLPSPIWFTTIDLVFAYIPMAWLAHILMQRFKASSVGE